MASGSSPLCFKEPVVADLSCLRDRSGVQEHSEYAGRKYCLHLSYQGINHLG